jgi:sugar lactone lactonase YvrE
MTFFLGTAGSTNNQLDNPHGFALDSTSNILYVADSGNHRIMRYQIGISSGVVVAGGNGFGLNYTQLWYPISVYFDSSSNSLFIVNYYSNTIVCWTLGASSWTLVAGNINGMSGATSTLLSEPSTVILDPLGNVYVSDNANQRIQFFLTNQTNGTTLAGITGISGDTDDLLDYPQGITFDAQLNLYVADSGNQRVQKFLRY